MSDNEESPISLAPYIKSCVKVMKFSGCVWYWSRRNCSYERFRDKIFKSYFVVVMIFLLMTSIYMLNYIDNGLSSSRQLALTLTIVNSNLQILMLYVNRDAFSRFIQATPQFSNKKAIEVQLKHAMKIIKPWTVLKGIVYVAILSHNLLSISEKLRNEFEEEVLVKVEANADFYGLFHIAGFAVQLMRVYTLTTMFVFQFGLSWLLMTVLIFINGYLNHLKLCLLRVKIRDPLTINVSWIDDYDLANGDCDMRYCVTMHQFIIRFVGQTNEIFSWVIQLVIWQTLTVFIIGIKLVLTDSPSATRIINFTVIYMLEMLCYCYLADDINRKSTNLSTICFQKLYAAGDMIVGDWKTLQVLAVRSQSHALDIKGGPFTVLNLRAFLAMFAVSLTLISFS